METKRKFITALSNMTMLKAPKVFSARAKRARGVRATIALLTAAAMLITPLGGIGPFGLVSSAAANENTALTNWLKSDAVTVTYTVNSNSSTPPLGGPWFEFYPGAALAPESNVTYGFGVPAVFAADDTIKIEFDTNSVNFLDGLDGVSGGETNTNASGGVFTGTATNLSGKVTESEGTVTLEAKLSEIVNSFSGAETSIKIQFLAESDELLTLSFLNIVTLVKIQLNGEDAGTGAVTDPGPIGTARSELIVDGPVYNLSYTNNHNNLLTNGIGLAKNGSEYLGLGDVIKIKPTVSGFKSLELNEAPQTGDAGGVFGPTTLAAGGQILGYTFNIITGPDPIEMGEPTSTGYIYSGEGGVITREMTVSSDVYKPEEAPLSYLQLNETYTAKVVQRPSDADVPIDGITAGGVEWESDGEEPEGLKGVVSISIGSSVPADGYTNCYLVLNDGETEVGRSEAFTITVLDAPKTFTVSNQDPNPVQFGINDEAEFDIFVSKTNGIGPLSDAGAYGLLVYQGAAANDPRIEFDSSEKIDLGYDDGNLEGTLTLTGLDTIAIGTYQYVLELYDRNPTSDGSPLAKKLGVSEPFSLAISRAPRPISNATVGLDVSYPAAASGDDAGKFLVTLTDIFVAAGVSDRISRTELEYAIKLGDDIPDNIPIDTDYKALTNANGVVVGGSLAQSPGQSVTAYVRYKATSGGSGIPGTPAGAPIKTKVTLPNAPAAPTELTAAVNTTDGRTVTLGWTAPGAAVNLSDAGFYYNGSSDKVAFPASALSLSRDFEYQVYQGATVPTTWKTTGVLSPTTTNESDYKFVVPAADFGNAIGNFNINIRAKNSYTLTGATGTFTPPVTLKNAMTGTPTFTSRESAGTGTDILTGDHAHRIGAYLTVNVDGVFITGAGEKMDDIRENGLAYRWFRGDDEIPGNEGGNEKTYQVKAQDAGKTLSVRISAEEATNTLTGTVVFGRYNTVPYDIVLTSPATAGAVDNVRFGEAFATNRTTIAHSTTPTQGHVGERIQIFYRMDTNETSNLLTFNKDVELGTVFAGKGTGPSFVPDVGSRVYVVNAKDVSAPNSGTINIGTTFAHNDAFTQSIFFANGTVEATYGDAAVTRTATIRNAWPGQNASNITYSIPNAADLARASINATTGAVEIKAAGEVTVHATLAKVAAVTEGENQHAEIAEATAEYKLVINPKPLPLNLEEIKYIAADSTGAGYVQLSYFGARGTRNLGTPAVDRAFVENNDQVSLTANPGSQHFAVDNSYISAVGGSYENARVDYLTLANGNPRFALEGAQRGNYTVVLPDGFTNRIDARGVLKITDIGEQQGNPVYGTAGTARFSITTENFEDGDYVVTLGDTYTGVSIVTVEGQTANTVRIRNNSGTLTLQTNATSTPAINTGDVKVPTGLTLRVPQSPDNNSYGPYDVTNAEKKLTFTVEKRDQPAPGGVVELVRGTATLSEGAYVYASVVPKAYEPLATEASVLGALEYAMGYGWEEPAVDSEDWKGIASTEMEDVGLGDTISVYVRFAGDGNNKPSPAKRATFRMPVEPLSPVVAAPEPGNTEVTLSWTAVLGNADGGQNAGYLQGSSNSRPEGFKISSYEIIAHQVNPNGSLSDNPLANMPVITEVGGALATTAKITGLTNGTSYNFRVVAVNSDGIKSVVNNSVRAMPLASYNESATVSILSNARNTAAAYAGNEIGATLTASLSASAVTGAHDAEKFEWTWYVDGKKADDVDRGNTSDFEITGADVGKAISVSVTHPQIKNPEAGSLNAVFDNGNTVPYTIKLDVLPVPIQQSGDYVSFETQSTTAYTAFARAGDSVPIHYSLARATNDNNRLSFNNWSNLAAVNAAKPASGATTPETGSRTYNVNTAAAREGVITIRATFTHSDNEIQDIFFTDEVKKITYGDMATFTNPLIDTGAGTGAIRYTIEGANDNVVRLIETGANAGQVTIMNAGNVFITATKEASTSTGANPVTYIAASTTYELIVEPKKIDVKVDPDASRYVATDKPGEGYVSLAYETVTTNGVRYVVLDESAIEFRLNNDGTPQTVKDEVLLPFVDAPARGSVNKVVSASAPVIIEDFDDVEFGGRQSRNYVPSYKEFTVDSTLIKSVSVDAWGQLVYGSVGVLTLDLTTTGLRNSREENRSQNIEAISYKAEVKDLPEGMVILDTSGATATRVVREDGAHIVDDLKIIDGNATITLLYEGMADADIQKDVTVVITDSNEVAENGSPETVEVKSDKFTVEIEKRPVRVNADVIYFPALRPGQGRVEITYNDPKQVGVGNTKNTNLKTEDILQKERGDEDLSLNYRVFAFTGDDRDNAPHALPETATVNALRPNANAVVTTEPAGEFYLSGAAEKNYRVAPLNTVDSTVFVTGISIDPADTTVRAGSPENFTTKFIFSDGKEHTPAVTKVDWSVFPETTLVTLSSKETNPTTLSTTVTEWETVELRASYQNTFMATVMVEVIPAGAKVEAQLLSSNVAVNRALKNGGRLPIRANMPIAQNKVGEGADEKIVGVRLYPAGTDLVNAPDGAKEISDFIAYMLPGDNSAIIISSTDTKSTDKMANGKNFAKVNNVEVWVLAEDGDANKAEDWQKATIGSSNTITITPSIRYPSIKADGRFQLNRFFPEGEAVIKMTSTAGTVGFADVPVAPQGNTNRIVAKRTSEQGVTPVTYSNDTVVLGSATSGNSQKARVTLTMDNYKPNMLRAYNTAFEGNKFDVTINISSQKPSLSVTPGNVSLRPATDRGRDVEIDLGGRNAWTKGNLGLVGDVFLEMRDGSKVSGVTYEDGTVYDSATALNSWYNKDYKDAVQVTIPGGTPAGNYRLRVNFDGVPASSPTFVNLTVSNRNGAAQLSVKPSTVTVNATDGWARFDISTNPLNLVDYSEDEPYKVVWQDGRTAKDLKDHPYILDFGGYVGGLWVDLDQEAITAAGTTLKSFSVPIRISNQQKDKAGNVRTSNTASATLRVETGAMMASFKSSGRISVIDPDSKMSYTMSLSRAGANAGIADIKIGAVVNNVLVPDNNFQAVITGQRSFDIKMMPTTPLGNEATATVNGYGYGYVVQGQNYDLAWEIELWNGTTINSWTNASGNNRRLRVTPNRPNASFKATPEASVTLFNNAPFRSDTVLLELAAPKAGDYQIITLSGKKDLRAADGTLTRTDGFGGNSGIEINRASTDRWTFRLHNRVALTRSNGSAPNSSYTLKLEAWPKGTYKLDANGNADLDANNRPQPINKSTKPTNVNVKVNIAR